MKKNDKVIFKSYEELKELFSSCKEMKKWKMYSPDKYKELGGKVYTVSMLDILGNSKIIYIIHNDSFVGWVFEKEVIVLPFP